MAAATCAPFGGGPFGPVPTVGAHVRGAIRATTESGTDFAVIWAPAPSRAAIGSAAAASRRGPSGAQPGAVTWVVANQRATCRRVSTPSLLKMLATWLSTVRSE